MNTAHATALRAASAIAALILLPGCAQWGGEVLEDNHVAFNTSVAEAMDRQLILNIVRLSEDAPTQWVTVTGITVNTSVGGSLSGAGAFPANSGAAAGNVNFSYTPTIQFVPRQGDQLAREVMSPIPVSSIENMVSAGWPISWLFFLTCERVQEVSGFDVTKAFGTVAHDERFGRLMELCDNLQERQLLSLSLAPMPVEWNETPIPAAEVTVDRQLAAKKDMARYRLQGDGSYDYVTIEQVPMLTLYPSAKDDASAKEFMQLLGLANGPGDYRLVAVEKLLPQGGISMRTRSLAGVLRLLSDGVDPSCDMTAPQDHIDTAHEVWQAIAATEGSASANITQTIRSFFRIQRSKRQPDSAQVSVQFEGEWFWIDRNDKPSRQVFSLVRDLFDLQVKTVSQQAPILNIPVGR